jgi:signal peptidase I
MIKDFLQKYDRKTIIRGTFWLLVYLLWVIWLGNYWFLLGLGVVFDMYFTKKVNWSPWKKREGKNNVVIEWLDALIFAVIAVTIINIFLFQNYKIPTGSMEKSLQIGDHLYVSKVAYGPRLPITPLSIPFMQNYIPGTSTNSYTTWPKWDYKRLKGFGNVKRWDPVVFNFPEGDTVIFEMRDQSYYMILDAEVQNLKAGGIKLNSNDAYYAMARKNLNNRYKVVFRPFDKEDNYIKRCVAIAGDSLEIKGSVVYINGEKEPFFKGRQTTYEITTTNGAIINPKYLTELGVNKEDAQNNILPLTFDMAEKISKYNFVERVEPLTYIKNRPMTPLFPRDSAYLWTLDDFGPIYIPKAGATVELNMKTLPFYKRIIQAYEGNKLEVKNNTIYINDKVATSYTFKLNYYWMMGDNRHNSLDSRYWGFVPETHIVGTPRFIWLSLNKDKSFPANIRLSRMFRPIN